ncbi:ATP-binding protein [Candidatus Thiosymbion oneisti]|uniref:nSTAND1 domain-containing NTPase n=1 Tax=Candidatus Thiosymbion oneisti TaxID=589554 RepID=UPI001061CF35|nr:ATP-binding protein [Candidatus Thiosymbion oneisti]
MNRSRTESLQTLFGGISAVTGIVSVVISVAILLLADEKSGAGLLDQIGLPSAIWLPVVLVLSLLLVVGGIWLVIRGLASKSRLLRPERLLIDPDNPDHLRGRDVELRRLAEAVTAQPLVFLEGESGAGKSALVRSGLIPALLDPPGARPARTMLPIYLNSYGGDWAQSLQERLVDAFWHQLGQDLRRQLAIENRDALHGQLLSAPSSPLLKRIRTELGWIPLLIFDQFDDYQVANRKHFLRDGRWIKADGLVTANPVWERIEQEIERGSLHLLFITRRDLVAGLEAVRFGNPECYALDRVESAFIGVLLDDLTVPVSKDQPVISHPNAGWDSLKRRLVNDLSEQHRILPIQARVVFRGLTRLPVLNTAAYERRGGLEGLEAAHVEDAMGAAAGAAGLTMAQTLALLLKLVDDSDPDAPKARSLPAADLAAASGIGRERSDRVLSVLDQEGIVRRRAGNGTDESPVWSLYHDYLARAVIAAHRRANRWQRLLKERRQALEGAGSSMSHWRSLLSPWEQLRLLGATLAGKVRWSGYRRFAVFSSLRWLPLLMLVVLTWVGTDQALEWQARQESQRILTAIRGGSGNDKPTGEEYRNLWTLASASPWLKRVFLEQSITDTESHKALQEHLEPVAQSLFGLDPNHGLRTRALDLAFRHKPATPYQAKLAVLVYQSAPDTFAARAPRIAELISTSMQKTAEPSQLSRLGEALGKLGEGLPAAQAQAVALRLVEVMDTTTDPEKLSQLGAGLGRLGEGLPAKQARNGALRLVEIMSTTTEPWQLSELGEVLGELGKQLPSAQAQSVALRLVEIMGTTTEPWQLSELGKALGKLGERLPAEQAQSVALRLVEVMGTITEPWQLSELGKALGKLGERLPAAQAQSGALRLVEVMGLKETTSQAFVSLAASLGDMPVAKNAAGAGIDTAPDLLQAPMAFDKDSGYPEHKTREQLLRYYSRLAGVFDTAEAFRTTDDLVAWVRNNRPSLDLTRPPRNPFR